MANNKKHHSNRHDHRGRSGSPTFSRYWGYKRGSRRVSSNPSQRNASSYKYLLKRAWFVTSAESPIQKRSDGYHTLSKRPPPFDDMGAMKSAFFDFIRFNTVPKQCIMVHATEESAREEAARMKADGHTDIKLHRIKVPNPHQGRWEFFYRSLTKFANESLGFYRSDGMGHHFLVAHDIAKKFVRRSKAFL